MNLKEEILGRFKAQTECNNKGIGYDIIASIEKLAQEYAKHLLYVQRINCGEAYMGSQLSPDQSTFYNILNASEPTL